jgi:aryl-alcohol dehydrogenase-like predicted oxidoreductase
MQYTILGRTELRVSVAGLGGGGFSRLDDRFHEPDHGTGDLLVDSSFAVR